MKTISDIKNILSSAKNIAVLEPHYDDAWINVGGFMLKNPDKQFTIISCCFDGPNSLNETRFLERFLPNVKAKALLFRGIHYDDRFKLSESEYSSFFVNLNNLPSYNNFEDVILEETKGFDIVLLPKGFKGKTHFFLSTSLSLG